MIESNDCIMDKVVDDLSFFSNNSNSVVLGSLSKNEYIKVNCSNKDLIRSIIMMFDGDHTDDDIIKYCEDRKVKIDIPKLKSELVNKGLFEGAELSNRKKNEMEMLGIKVFLKSFPYNREFAPKKLVSIMMKLFYVTSAVFLLYILFHLHNISDLFQEDLLKYKDSYVLGMVYTLLISFAVLLLHEFGHCIIAYINGIQIHKIGLYLYIGILPKWFINFRGIRVADKKLKLKVFSGGIFFNLELIILSCFLYSFYGDYELLKCLIVSNLFMILNCLIPFTLTDGYFIFSTIFNIDNLRKKMFESMSDLIHFRVSLKKTNIYLFLLINIIFYLYRIFLFYYWLLVSLLEMTNYAYVIIGLLVGVHMTMLIRRIYINNNK